MDQINPAAGCREAAWGSWTARVGPGRPGSAFSLVYDVGVGAAVRVGVGNGVGQGWTGTAGASRMLPIITIASAIT
jgi:hypothetical protein